MISGVLLSIVLAKSQTKPAQEPPTTLPTERGFQLYAKQRGVMTATEDYLNCEPGKRYRLTVARPPNLPTQTIIDDSVEVKGAKVLRKFSAKLNTSAQEIWVLEVIPSGKTMSVTVSATIWSYIQANSIGSEPVTAMPAFLSDGSYPAFDFKTQKFEEWYKVQEMAKQDGENWSSYIERTYRRFDKLFKYSRMPVGPGNRKIDRFHASGICQGTEFGCTSTAILYCTILSKQSVPCFHVFGAYAGDAKGPDLRDGKSCSHSFVFANLAPFGWKLLDPTSALDGISYGAMEGASRYVVFNIAQIGGVRDPETGMLFVGNTSDDGFSNGVCSEPGGGTGGRSSNLTDAKYRPIL